MTHEDCLATHICLTNFVEIPFVTEKLSVYQFGLNMLFMPSFG